MQLTEVERKITKDILDKFLTENAPTSRRSLISQYKEPDALAHLIQKNLIEQLDNMPGAHYLPKLFAFHYCADEDTQGRAKRSVETLITALQQLYDTVPEKVYFTVAEIEAAARKIVGEGFTSETLKLGLYLISEFFEVVCGVSGKRTEIIGLTVNESIVKIKDVAAVWDSRMPRDLQPAEPTPEDRNILWTALHPFCSAADLGGLLVAAHSKPPAKTKVSAAFELHVAWLLGLFGFSTIVLGDYEQVVSPATGVRRASVDILAASQSENALLLVGCTLNEPGPKDFSTLRYAREIVAREAFEGKSVRIVPVVFTAAMDDRSYDRIADRPDAVPIIDTDDMKNLLQLLPNGRESALLGFLQNLAPTYLWELMADLDEDSTLGQV
jgi:hypothetical protein